MAKVSMFWHGELALMHHVCINSFIYYGHSVKIYSYDKTINVNKAVEIADANEIIPYEYFLKHNNDITSFSDIFRYNMISKTGEMWVDADTMCFSDYFFDNEEYVFVTEGADLYSNNVLKMPKDSNLLKFLLMKISALSREDIGNGEIGFLGPKILTEGVNKFNLNKHAIDQIFKLGDENPRVMWQDPKFLKEMIARSKKCICGTFFNSDFAKHDVDRNEVVPGSAMHYFYKKFIKV